jgi:hypothetical protein
VPCLVFDTVSGCSHFADLSRFPWGKTAENELLGSGAANVVVSQVGLKFILRVGVMHTGPNTVSADLSPIFQAFASMIDQDSPFGGLLFWSLQMVSDGSSSTKHAVPHEVHFKERDHGSRLPAVPSMLFGVDTPVYQKMLCLDNISALEALLGHYPGLVSPVMLNIEIHHRANCSLGTFLTSYPSEISFLDLAVFAFGYIHDQLLMTETSNFTFTDAHEGNLLVIRSADGRMILLFADAGQTSNEFREQAQLDRVVLRIRDTLLGGWGRVPHHDATYRALSASDRLIVDRYMPQVIGSLRARRDDETSVLLYLRNMFVDVNVAITAMVSAADLRDQFDRRLGSSSVMSLHVRSIRQGQDINDLRVELDSTKSELTDVRVELDSTKSELTDVRVELDSTKSELTDVRVELDSTKSELTGVNVKFNASEAKHRASELRQSKLQFQFDQLSQTLQLVLQRQELQDSKVRPLPDFRDEL